MLASGFQGGEGLTIREGLTRIATEYLNARNQRRAEHPLAAFIRREFPPQIEAVINLPGTELQLAVEGAPMPGRWAAVPWVGIFDQRLTATARSGVYAVLLFAENMGAITLCLAMGVTDTSPEIL